ncbi:N-acyl homoserine lactonase family protein [Limibacillus halophilus]
MPDESYEVYAIKYGHFDRPDQANFLDGQGDGHNMPLDYFVWAIVGKERSFVVDCGFGEESGKARGRTMTAHPAEGLKAIGLDPKTVEQVIVTHMHYDHAGNHELFPRARFHLQEREMHFCTGRCMCHSAIRYPFDVEDVAAMLRKVFEGRVTFHDGASEIAPGLSVHWIGGHTDGLQVVRVRTRRGWLVLASDASHFYANMDQERPFPIVYNLGDMLAGYRTLDALAESHEHVIPGHDPLVLQRYPAAAKGLEGWVVRLDADPLD